MNAPEIKIKIEPINAEPVKLTKFENAIYRRSGKLAFIVGKEFNASFRYSNIGNIPLTSGKIIISIHWSNGFIVNVPIELSNFNPGDEDVFHFKNQGIVTPGYALFSSYVLVEPPINYSDRDGKSHEKSTYPVYRDEHNIIDPRVSFFSIYSQTAEEFFQYWAMILAAVGLVYFLLKDVIMFLFSFFTCAP